MPRFSDDPPTTYELRELWRTYRDHGVVQRVILEIVRLRKFFGEVEALRQIIRECWYQETETNLVALEVLRADLADERARSGVMHEPARPLPPFVAPTRLDVDGIEQHYAGDVGVQRLCGEIRHARAFVLRIDGLHIVIQRCWRFETDTDLAAIERLRERLAAEKERAGVIPTADPAQREQEGLTARIPLDFDGTSTLSRT